MRLPVILSASPIGLFFVFSHGYSSLPLGPPRGASRLPIGRRKRKDFLLRILFPCQSFEGKEFGENMGFRRELISDRSLTAPPRRPTRKRRVAVREKELRRQGCCKTFPALPLSYTAMALRKEWWQWRDSNPRPGD